MISRQSSPHIKEPFGCSHRQFIGGTLAAAASGSLLEAAATFAAENSLPPESASAKQKIKLGLVGCGGRGSWIAKLFQQHGGYEMHAVADYFHARGRPLRRCPGRGPKRGGSPAFPATRR